MGIRNIWQNDFYNESPVSKWAWEIDFLSFLPKDTIEAYKLEDYLKILNKAIVSCVWGKREMSVVNTYFGGIQANFPGRIQNAGEINIKFNENQSMLVSQTLEILFNLQSHNQKYFEDDEIKGYTYDPLSMKYIKENILRLKVKKPIYNVGNEELDDNNVIALLEFHNCFIKGINEEELSYENTEDILTRTVSISYDYMTYGKALETSDQNKDEEMIEFDEVSVIDEEGYDPAAAYAAEQKASEAAQAAYEAGKETEANRSAQDAYEKARAEAEVHNADQEQMMVEAAKARMTRSERESQSAAQAAYEANKRAAAEREQARNEEEAQRRDNEEKTQIENEKWQSRGNAKRS